VRIDGKGLGAGPTVFGIGTGASRVPQREARAFAHDTARSRGYARGARSSHSFWSGGWGSQPSCGPRGAAVVPANGNP